MMYGVWDAGLLFCISHSITGGAYGVLVTLLEKDNLNDYWNVKADEQLNGKVLKEHAN